MFHGYGKSRLKGFWKPGYIEITGGISSVDVPELEMAWIIEVLAVDLRYDKDDTFSMKLRIKALHSKRSPALDRLALVGPPFLEKSTPFAALQKFFSRFQPYGQVDVTLDASGNLNQISESKLSGQVNCKDVSFCFYKFPYKIEQLTGQIDFTEDKIILNKLTGKHGDAELLFNGWSQGFGPDWKYEILVTGDNIALDNDLYSVLNTRQKETWSAFSPTGYAAIEYLFNRHSEIDKQQKLTLEPRGAQANYQRFSYPLKNLPGKLVFEHGNITLSDVVSHVDDCKITLNGQVINNKTDSSKYNIYVD